MSKEERPWLDHFERAFAADRYRFLTLLKNIATSPELYAVGSPSGAVATANENGTP
jgi:hypothetical protein